MSTASLSLKTESELDHAVEPNVRPSPSDVITVCHPVWSLESGGLERQMLNILGGLSAGRFRHLIVTRGPVSEQALGDLPDHVEVICQDGPQRDLLWSRRLASILVDHHVDVLHLRGLAMLTDGVLAAQFAGRVRVAMSFHGFETSPPQIGPIKRRVLRWAIGRCDACWAVSATAAAALAHELNMEADEFDVLNNGVDLTRFAPSKDRDRARRHLGFPGDRPVILTVGNLKPIKGHDVLLEAVAHLPPSAARAILVFVGQDYLNGALQRYAASQLPDQEIHFVGHQDDVLPWYQAADFFVLPSLWEGMSNALLEAMSCGLAVIATGVGGTCDVVDHGRTGLLVQPGCAQQLVDAMGDLLADASRRAKLGAAARRHVEQYFNIASTRDQYERRYMKLAGRTEGDA